jgi:hypothetical protein
MGERRVGEAESGVTEVVVEVVEVVEVEEVEGGEGVDCRWARASTKLRASNTIVRR